MTTTLSTEQTVGGLVADRPERSKIFEQLGIDYCCGGKKPLAQACAAKGLDVGDVLKKLVESDSSAPATGIDWVKASLTDLADHIEATHHAYLKDALPRITALIGKVVNAHGAKNPKLQDLSDVFSNFRSELECHMMKEERILFPLCRQLDGSAEPQAFHCGSIQNPIRVMVAEHDDAGEALAAMRSLTDDFVPPPGACNTYRAMLHALGELERDMHQHVHKENSILFPKAEAVESALGSAAR